MMVSNLHQHPGYGKHLHLIFEVMPISTENQRETVLDRQVEKLAPPPMYQVVLLNDDYTPMEFVVGVLQRIFGKDEDEAARIMLKVHHEGRGVCGVYTRDIASTRVEMVRQLARARQHPLQCVMEPAPDV
jgi:ATP-dependent Clp protease adaptor protein ClpS